MNAAFSILSIMAPLLLLTLGALVSEYGGRLAMFMEHIINFSAFLCYTFSLLCGSVVLGVFLSMLISTLSVFLLERISSRLKANMFLVSLSMNLLFQASSTFLSVLIFKTRGVLYSSDFSFSVTSAKIITSIFCIAFSLLIIFMLKKTSLGLCLRICGSDSEVLSSQGRNPEKYKSLSWIIAALAASFCGCTYCIRLSSFVPGMSGGRGWTALAAVFLGRKHPSLAVVAAAVFAVSEYCSSNIQNIEVFSEIPSSILLALPYLVSLLLILIMPQKKATS